MGNYLGNYLEPLKDHLFNCRPGVTVVESVSKPGFQGRRLSDGDDKFLGTVQNILNSVEDVGPASDEDTDCLVKSSANVPHEEPDLLPASSPANTNFSIYGFAPPHWHSPPPPPANDLKSKLAERVKKQKNPDIRNWLNQAIHHLFDNEKEIVEFLEVSDNPKLLDFFVEYLAEIMSKSFIQVFSGVNKSGDAETWGMVFLESFKLWNRIIPHVTSAKRLKIA